MSMAWDEIPGDRDATIKRRFENTVAVVSATDFETFMLWKEWSNESTWTDPAWKRPRVKWEQVNPGYIETIGYVGKGKDEMPVAIELTWVRINGQMVLFWEASSQMVDYRMMEPWLEKQFGKKGWPKWDNGHRRMSTNGMNFGHAIEAVDEANGIK